VTDAPTNSPAREAEGANNAPAGRRVDEWIATHPDQAIPKSVKLRIWEREGGRCYLTGLKINALKDAYEFEHVIALAHGGQHRESNIKLALKEPHKVKSADDAKITAKIRRMSLKDKGLWPKSKTPLRSRGFEKTRSQAGTTGADLSPGRNK
jgi:5-methylcytosine-specific restriction protein A